MGKLSIKGVVIGGVAEVGLSLVCGLVLGIYLVFSIASQHLPKARNHAATVAALHSSYWLFLMVGLLCSVVGGYAAARLAKHDHLLNGAFSSWLCLLIELVTFARGFLHPTRGLMMHSIWTQSLLMVAAIGCGLVGGYLALAQARSKVVRPA